MLVLSLRSLPDTQIGPIHALGNCYAVIPRFNQSYMVPKKCTQIDAQHYLPSESSTSQDEARKVTSLHLN